MKKDLSKNRKRLKRVIDWEISGRRAIKGTSDLKETKGGQGISEREWLDHFENLLGRTRGKESKRVNRIDGKSVS